MQRDRSGADNAAHHRRVIAASERKHVPAADRDRRPPLPARTFEALLKAVSDHADRF